MSLFAIVIKNANELYFPRQLWPFCGRLYCHPVPVPGFPTSPHPPGHNSPNHKSPTWPARKFRLIELKRVTLPPKLSGRVLANETRQTPSFNSKTQTQTLSVNTRSL